MRIYNYKIKVIEKYGKSIDSLNIINYKNDTVYIYHEYDQKDFIAESFLARDVAEIP